MVLNNNADRALTHNEKILRTKCYWAMATAHLGFSYTASQNIPELTEHVPSKGLVSIGPCPLHIIHNAFKHGFTQPDWQIEEILYDFWFFFSQSSARREDYLNVVKAIGDGVGRFMKRFVITHWIEV
ncbi:unnamed protein product, partial [Rotaria sp. Silwood1]